MKNTTGLFKVLKHWKHVSGYSDRQMINHNLLLEFEIPKVVEYVIPVESVFGLNEKSILYFSDLHYKGENCFDFSALIDKINPDWIVFGGDLVTYACFIEGAMEWLNKNFADFEDIPKLAVPGNWDRRRREWFPLSIWYEKYKKAGFELLVNQRQIVDNLCFWGVDEPKMGKPLLDPARFEKGIFNCIISHSVEPVIDNTMECQIQEDCLALCGHTHAGQIRIPLFGAVFTSTKYWKLFEYGLYIHKCSKLNMIMTSGLGTSRIPFRLFCQPEVVMIRFTDK